MEPLSPPPISRRRLLEAGSLALFSGAVRPSPARAAERSVAPRGRGAKSCILVYLLGGPAHLDMFDLKPDAPAEIRGPFKPISTNVPGLQICEHLPQLARQAHRFALVRSVTYPNNDHPYMIYHTLTGRVSPDALEANTVLPPKRSDHPHMGAVVAKFKHERSGIPGYVAIPEVQVRMQQTPVSGGGRAGFLGQQYEPLAINDDPRQPLIGLNLPGEVSVARFERRQQLLAVLEGTSARSRQARDYQTARDSAARLVQAAGATNLFALDKEPVALSERYGRHRFGQSMLLARRLVERGVSFVAIHFNHMTKCDGWDTHANNFAALQGELLPLVDQSLSALLDDLATRGLLDETLVVVMGEFGRTPKINANAGRDHWGDCASVLFAGGGVRGGNLVGASDRLAAYPTERQVGPPDIVTTIYHALGLQPETVMTDPLLNRTMALSDGKVISELF